MLRVANTRDARNGMLEVKAKIRDAENGRAHGLLASDRALRGCPSGNDLDGL